jgi:predicted AlkP superfamily phosphohydrolase/phosphomutase
VCDQVARGNLPAFRTMLRNGSYGPLATLRPTEGPPIWTTIVSGKLPRDHGVKSFIAYQLRGSKSRYELLPRGVFIGTLQRIGLVSVYPVSASARKVKTLWNALNAFGIDVGIVRLWGTHPVEKVRGFMLSHYFHALPTKRLAEALYPMTLIQEVTAKRVSQADLDSAFISQFVDTNVTAADAEYPWWQQDLMRDALSPDLTYLRAGSVLREAYDPPFFATYFFGLDVVGHSFLRYARPEQFGDVSPAEVRRYGHVRDRYMAFLGQVVAETIDRLRDDEVLIVLSAYGMRPVSLWRRVIAGMS